MSVTLEHTHRLRKSPEVTSRTSGGLRTKDRIRRATPQGLHLKFHLHRETLKTPSKGSIGLGPSILAICAILESSTHRLGLGRVTSTSKMSGVGQSTTYSQPLNEPFHLREKRSNALLGMSYIPAKFPIEFFRDLLQIRLIGLFAKLPYGGGDEISISPAVAFCVHRDTFLTHGYTSSSLAQTHTPGL